MKMVADQIPKLIDDPQRVLEQVPLEPVELEGSDEIVERLLDLELGEPRVQAQAEQKVVGLRQVRGELLIEQPEFLEPVNPLDLADPALRDEALGILRGLIERVVLHAAEGGLQVEIVGEIVKMIELGLDAKQAALPTEAACSVKVVAGAGFEPATFRL
jgi:hypothetical protein